MVEPPSRPPSTVDDLLQSIAEIDRSLKRFQQEILPQMRKFGIDLSGWALSFGSSFQRDSQDLYTSVQQRVLARGGAESGGAENGGGYLYQDLADLDNARRLAERADRLRQAGLIAARAVDAAVWAGGIYRHASARAAIMLKLLEVQKSLPVLQAQVARSEARIQHFLENDDRLFQLLAARRVTTDAERLSVDRDLGRVVESYRRLYESLARLKYYQAVFKVVAGFEPHNFAQTMQGLQEKGVQDRQLYLLEGNAYLQRLEVVLGRLGWEGPYYQAGLPEGLRFFIAEGRRQLPPGVQLRSLDDAVARMRRETPGPARPVEWARAAGYLTTQLKDPFLFSPVKRNTFQKLLLGVVFIAAGILLLWSGAAEMLWNGLVFLAGAAGHALSLAFPVNNTGQVAALVIIALILLAPLSWIFYLLIKKQVQR